MIKLSLDLILAFMFFLSSYMKLKNPHEFRIEIISYGLISNKMIKTKAIIIILLEILLAVALVCNYMVFQITIIGILLLLFFTLANVRKKRLHKNVECNCFGTVKILNKFPNLRNFLLMALFLLRVIFPGNKQLNTDGFLLSILLVIAVLMIDIILEYRRNKYLRCLYEC